MPIKNKTKQCIIDINTVIDNNIDQQTVRFKNKADGDTVVGIVYNKLQQINKICGMHVAVTDYTPDLIVHIKRVYNQQTDYLLDLYNGVLWGTHLDGLQVVPLHTLDLDSIKNKDIYDIICDNSIIDIPIDAGFIKLI